MNITLYTNNSERNRAKKSLVSLGDKSVKLLTDNTDIINPSFLLSTVIPDGLNYIYVPAWKRYYFVTNISQNTQGLYEIECHVDILSTAYAGNLKSCKGIVSRQQLKYNGYLQDDNILAQQKPLISYKKFPNGFRQDGIEYVLLVNGH